MLAHADHARDMGRYWLGIDIGGTFTDFTLFDTATQVVTGLKVASTPPDFAAAVESGLEQLAGEYGIDPREIEVVVHGTTIAVNTLIQRTGARLGLLVTEGFRDVLEIQRLRLPNPLDMNGRGPVPLVPRDRVAEVRERLRADGSVDTALDDAGVAAAARGLAAHGVEGLVISLLHAYRDPVHERRARIAAEAVAPGIPVSNLRVQLRGRRPRVPLVEVAAGTGAILARVRRIWLDGHPVEARVFERASLGAGDRLVGPAIVEQPDTTVLVPGGHVANVDRFGNLHDTEEG
jgi:N-methylhydantoinase A/oxoprolinase/acetone carboxylase beta subunit